MITRVCGRLLRECPWAPILTLHDSILTTDEYVAIVERVILEEWMDVYKVERRPEGDRLGRPPGAAPPRRSGVAAQDRHRPAWRLCL